MSRTLSASILTEIAKGLVRPRLIARIGAVTGDVLVWNGVGNLTWNGDTYTGVGTLGGVSEIEETTDLQANGVKFTLSGIPSSVLAVAIGEMQQGLPAKLWLAFVDASNALVLDPVLLHDGLTDVPSIAESGETCTVSISSESRLIDFQKARVRRYTPEDQKFDDPADLGFQFVAGLQDKQIVFGKT